MCFSETKPWDFRKQPWDFVALKKPGGFLYPPNRDLLGSHWIQMGKMGRWEGHQISMETCFRVILVWRPVFFWHPQIEKEGSLSMHG